MKRGSFASRFGTIAAVGGSVIGLGNIWRFPYVAGENGGAAFILIYLTISFLISIPIMLSEFSLGRSTKRNSMRAFSKLAPGTKWKWVGYMGILCAFIILSFYCVIAGWSLEFLKESVLNRFHDRTPEQVAAAFDGFVASGWRPIAWTLVFIAASAFIVYSGIEKGIERYNKILMPMLFLLLFGMALKALTARRRAPGDRLSAEARLQQDHRNDRTGSPRTILLLDEPRHGLHDHLRLLSAQEREYVPHRGDGLAVGHYGGRPFGTGHFPRRLLVRHLAHLGSGAGFLTLPNVFARMSGGYVISVVFFVLLFLAAITSSVSLLEVIIAYLSEEMRITRSKAIVCTACTVAATGSLSALSMMPGSVLTIGGKNLFDLCDSLSSNLMMPLGGLFIVLFAGWVLSPRKLRDEMTSGLKYGTRVFPVVRFLIRFVIPVVIGILFASRIGLLF